MKPNHDLLPTCSSKFGRIRKKQNEILIVDYPMFPFNCFETNIFETTTCQSWIEYSRDLSPVFQQQVNRVGSD